MADRNAPWQMFVPPPVLAFFLALLGWWIPFALGVPMQSGLMIWPLGLVIILAGLALAFWGIGLFARNKTELAPQSSANQRLVVSGPFQFSRNPIYLGVMIALLGVPFTSGMWPQFAAAIIFFLWINTFFLPYEEAKMERQFGDEYRAYKRSVRRWI